MGESSDSESILARLMAVILDRRDRPSPKSYTSQLLAGGVERIGAKITEEAAEVVEAAADEGAKGADHLAGEVADLVYHLLVMLAQRGLHLSDVEAKLAERFGISGIEEKASRRRHGAVSDNPAESETPATD